MSGYRLDPQPVDAATAPRPLYRSASLEGPMPAGRWWSSLVCEPFSHPMYPHPLAAQASPRGLELDTPSVAIGIDAQFGSQSILAEFAGDLVIAAEGVVFAEALVDGHSDWSVTILFPSGAGALRATLAHGSPFAYVTCEAVTPALEVADTAAVWANKGETIAFTVNDHRYAAFLPPGGTWEIDGTRMKPRDATSRFSVAALPDGAAETLELFAAVAHDHVVSTEVRWRYDEERSRVHAEYAADVGGADATLLALYPHQWRALDDESRDRLTGHSYATVRGGMRLIAGDSFSTTVPFPGALPYMPTLGNETERVRERVDEVAGEGDHHLTNLIPHAAGDMYWTGVSLGRITALVPVAERVGADSAVDEFVAWLKATIEGGSFWWDEDWSTVIGYPGGFGADTELNDHHYQYAYWIRAAIEIARHDRTWIDPERWGGLIDLLVRDIATYRRDDPVFPFLRNFDVYAGHSWATGIQRFADGANSESSSEAIAAWAAVLLWAEAIGDRELRDFAAFLYATEISAAEEYWFDVHHENFPAVFDRAMAGQVWGGKTSYSVWWTDDPEPMRGISFLPLTPTSFYLGRRPEYVRANLADLRRLRPEWSYWPDILWCYEALADPARALALLEAADSDYTEGHSESRAHTLSWILDLLELGALDIDVTADAPSYAAFRSGTSRTYIAFNAGASARDVHFSDGTTLAVEGERTAILRRAL